MYLGRSLPVSPQHISPPAQPENPPTSSAAPRTPAALQPLVHALRNGRRPPSHTTLLPDPLLDAEESRVPERPGAKRRASRRRASSRTLCRPGAGPAPRRSTVVPPGGRTGAARNPSVPAGSDIGWRAQTLTRAPQPHPEQPRQLFFIIIIFVFIPSPPHRPIQPSPLH